MSEYIVGLRGGIGTGKSTVSEIFSGKGVFIADADIAARRIVKPGLPAYNSIVEYFGREILKKNGELNRAKLRKIVFKDKVKRNFLESRTRERIVTDLLEQVSNAESPYALLVLSTGLGKVMGMNRLLVVDAPTELQIKRVMSRDNNTRNQVESIIAAQPSRGMRIKDADDIIVNDDKLESLSVEVDKLHSLYLTLAGREN